MKSPREEFGRTFYIFLGSIVFLCLALATMIERAVAIKIDPLMLLFLTAVWAGLALSYFFKRSKDDASYCTVVSVVMYVAAVLLLSSGYLEMALFPLTITMAMGVIYPFKVLQTMEM